MKLIIDLPKEKFEWIKTHNLNIDNNSIVGAVANGIPYNPTGNLISRSEVVKTLENIEIGKFNRINVIETIKSISIIEKPQGDLISREALKEAFEDCTGECACCVHNTNDFEYCGLIDDAPAV